MSFDPKNSPRENIVLALMQLANTHEWNDVTLPMIAEKAGVSLDIMREYFPSKGAMLAGFAKIIDAKVLKGTTADMNDEPVRDRLLDIMLRRFDALSL
jgi:AcrR family transcriptional regulator